MPVSEQKKPTLTVPWPHTLKVGFFCSLTECLVAFPTSHRRHHYMTRMLIASKECDSFTYRAQRQAPSTPSYLYI